ncbi:MAG: phosphoglycerate kinase [bacterium]
MAGSIGFGKMTMNDVRFGWDRVLMRVDFNGTTENGTLKSTKRIETALPSIRYALDNGASQVILMSHNGKTMDIEVSPEKFSLAPAAPYLAEQLGIKADFIHGFKNPVKSDARVVLMENTRGDSRDEAEKEDEDKKIAIRMSYAQEIIAATNPGIYVLDGFSVSHRDQASVTLPAMLMKQAGKPAVAGNLLYTEYTTFVEKIINNPQHPFLAFLGGAKVDTKMPMLSALLPNVEGIVVGGAMAFPFMLEKGMKVEGIDPFSTKDDRQKELSEERERAHLILSGPNAHKVIIPTLVVGPDKNVIDILKDPIPANFTMKDIMITDIAAQLAAAGYKTIFFNGTFGAFEEKLGGYTAGTYEVFRFMSRETEKRAFTVVGGGDTMDALKGLKKIDKSIKFSHETDGGGASGELLALGFDGRAHEFPGYKCLSDKQ